MVPIKQGSYEFKNDVLVDIRKSLNLSQAKMAELLGLPPNTLSRWETGATVPDAASLAAIYSMAKEQGLDPPPFFSIRSNPLEMKLSSKSPGNLQGALDFYQVLRSYLHTDIELLGTATAPIIEIEITNTAPKTEYGPRVVFLDVGVRLAHTGGDSDAMRPSRLKMQVRLKPAESDRAHPSSPWELDSKRSELLQLNYYRSSGSEGLPNYSVDNNTQLNILFPGQTVIHQIEAPPDVLPYLQFRVQGTVSRRHLFFCEETFTMPETFTKPLVLRALLDFNSVPVFEPLQETLKSMPKFDANTSLADIKEFAGVLTSNVDRIKALKEALNKVYLDHKLNWFKAHIRGAYIFLNRVSAALVSMQNAIASHDSDKIAAESSSIQALETEAAQLERETREIMGKHAVSDQELRYTRVDDVKQALRTASRFKSESDAPNIQTAADELDLHAMTVEEAIPLVDRYLEDSYNANKRRVWIVHGKGTGVLRTEVGRHLKGHKLVKSFAIAGNDRGGEGATQVDLID